MGNTIITWLRANAWTWATTAWDWFSWAVLAIWRSFVALLKSPAAWLACTLLFIVGFSTGFVTRGEDVRTLKIELADVKHDKAAVDRQLSAANDKIRGLVNSLEAAEKKLKEAEVRQSAPAPAAKPKRQRTGSHSPAQARRL